MDLNLINANVSRLLTNIRNIIIFLKEYTVDGAKDVSITHIDDSGTAMVKTFPNITKQMGELETWKGGFQTVQDNTYSIFKEFPKTTILVGQEAVFNIQGFDDAYLINMMLVVNVAGGNDSSPNAAIDIFWYSPGSNSFSNHQLANNAIISGRNWHDNYRDVNIVPIGYHLPFGIGTFKIVNVGTQDIEIFAIGAKLRK